MAEYLDPAQSVEEESGAKTTRKSKPLQVKPVLSKEERRKRRRKNFRLLLFILTLAAGLLLGFFLGRNWPRRTEVSFYATILETDENTLFVEGIAENDVNHRHKAYLSLDDLDTEGMAQTASGENIAVGELKVGELVKVTYDGTVLETYPLQIPHVWRIERTQP